MLFFAGFRSFFAFFVALWPIMHLARGWRTTVLLPRSEPAREATPVLQMAREQKARHIKGFFFRSRGTGVEGLGDVTGGCLVEAAKLQMIVKSGC